MAEGFDDDDVFPPLVCQLWFDSVPSHDNPLLHALVGDALDHVAVDDSGVLSVTHASLVWVSPEGDPGWGRTEVTSAPVDALPSLAQTWWWPEAGTALAGAKGTLVLQERLGGWVDPLRRVDAFRRVLGIVVDAMRPRALVWPGADVVTDPDLAAESLVGVFNVRRQPSPEALDGWLIDTLGLEILNIPDLEIHARGLDPETLAGILLRHAEAFVRGTEFIADGDPVMEDGAGPEGGDLWFTARYRDATAAPTHRRVVAFLAPSPYGLGAPDEPSAEEN